MATSDRCTKGSSQSKHLQADEILDLILDGNISEIEDLEEDEAEQQHEVILANQEEELEEIEPEEGSEEEDDSETTHHMAERNLLWEYDLTEKSKIQRRRSALFSPPEDQDWVPDPEEDIFELLTPRAYFNRYITKDLIKSMTEMTNIYMLQKSITNCSPATEAEIEILIGLHIIMGNLRYPRVRMYWDSMLGLPLFKESMEFNRFFKLRNALHIVNNMEHDSNDTDRLFKVRPIYNAIRERCLQLPLERELCVDEQIVPFKGQLNIKQYVKGKPCPWGIKIFHLCGKSGIFYDFLIYQGETTEINRDLQKAFGHGAAVVLYLSDRIKSKNHQLYFDNYFNSYHLLQICRRKHILAAGTVRLNRFCKPPLISDKDMKKKERGYCEEVSSNDGDVLLTKWQDNKAVVMGSNFIGKGTMDMARRWDKKKREYVDVPRPEVIQMYNCFMGGSR